MNVKIEKRRVLQATGEKNQNQQGPLKREDQDGKATLELQDKNVYFRLVYFVLQLTLQINFFIILFDISVRLS